MPRVDPFFVTQLPHRTNWLESMHRTYPGPPQHDSEAFHKALKFRLEEKNRYAALERANKQHEAMSKYWEERYNTLRGETDQVKKLWEQLSKMQANAERTTDPPTPDDGGGGVSQPDTPAPGADQVPGAVLQPDPRGHAEEHAAEGPEHGAGAGVSAPDGVQDSVRQGED